MTAQLVVCRLHIPRDRDHDLVAFSKTAPTGPICKPFVSPDGRAGYVAALPDVWPRTQALARKHVLASIYGKRAHIPAAETSPAQLRDLLFERMQPLLQHDAELEPAQAGLICRTGATTLILEPDPTVLTVALPRLQALAEDVITPLCGFAARFHYDSPLCRFEVEQDSCRLAIHVPLPPPDRLAAVAWSACRALRSAARSLPPLALLVAPGFRPLLELAGSGQWPVSVPATPGRS